jgi:cell wall-associated NlpC family hydrolase
MNAFADALEAAARRWLGTPWCANSAAPGPAGGVACHRLPCELYRAAGVWPEGLAVPAGSPNEGRHAGSSPIPAWLDAQPEFARLQGGDAHAAGVLLGFSLHGACVAHLGVVLAGRRFIHVLQHRSTVIDLLDDPTWARRRRAAWRLAVLPV